MTIPDLSLEAGLPASVDGERTILGSILLDNQAFIEAAEYLAPDDFSLDSHRRIFLRMSELMDSQHAVDIVTLSNELARSKEIEAVGGVAYIASLTEGLPRRPVIEEYIRIVKDKSLLRKLMGICSMAIARAADQGESATQIGVALAGQVQAALTAGTPSTLQRVGDYLKIEFPTPESMIDKTAKSQGLETGFRKFDSMTCGAQKGDLIIIAARPSQGKTSLAMNIAEHMAVNCESRVVINSLEMSKEALMRRAICSRGRVPFQDHRSGEMAYHVRMVEDFREAYEEISRSQIFIDDTPKTAVQIATQWRSKKEKENFDIGIIDFLTLLQHDDEPRRQRNETQLVGHDCLILKVLAKELGIPIILLCQLSRELMKRTDKRPMLSDLRESGRIEEYADVVSFIHRESYYDPKNEALKNQAEWIIAKQRNGPIGTIDLHWEPEYLRFSDPIDPKDLQNEFSMF
jgi:replicative DNA helicase